MIEDIQVQKVFEPPSIFYVWLAIILLAIAGFTYINQRLGLPDDNAAEEFIEEVIKNKIGMDIDLTPETRENGRSQPRS